MKPQKSNQRQLLGKYGENLAALYLQKHGYRIIELNFRARYGEIDIVALVDNTVVFVEVKTRMSETFGKPEEAVTPRKLREVVQTAQYYSHTHNVPESMRIDVIGIILTQENEVTYFNHLKSVTS